MSLFGHPTKNLKVIKFKLKKKTIPKKKKGFIPISIGNHVLVQPNTIISAAKIGSNV